MFALFWTLNMRFYILLLILIFRLYYYISVIWEFLLGCKAHTPSSFFFFSELQDDLDWLWLGFTGEQKDK